MGQWRWFPRPKGGGLPMACWEMGAPWWVQESPPVELHNTFCLVVWPIGDGILVRTPKF